jgi:hypothetical protein
MHKLVILTVFISSLSYADMVTNVNVYSGSAENKSVQVTKTAESKAAPKPVLIKKIMVRMKSPKMKTNPTVTHEIVREVVREKTVEKKVYVDRVVVKKYVKHVPDYKDNTIRIVGGFGPLGVSKSTYPDSVTLNQNAGPVFGLEYSRQIDDDWSVAGMVLTNGTILVGPGFSW